MLWKYKKIYQETNEDIIDPVLRICYRIFQINLNRTVPPFETPSSLDIVECRYEEVLNYTLNVGNNIIEVCGDIDTIVIPEIDLITNPITQAEIEDAILNNAGVVSRLILDMDLNILGSINIIFSECG